MIQVRSDASHDSAIGKTFSEQQHVGAVKYVVNHHDGAKTHRDGSPFFDVALFSNKRKKDRFVRDLKRRGYQRRR